MVIAVIVPVALVLFYQGASLAVWTTACATALAFYTISVGWSIELAIAWGLFLSIATLLNVRPIRCHLITEPVLRFFQFRMPSMSRTEEEALQAGSVSWEGDLFSGDPDWHAFLSLPVKTLTKAERDFLTGPVDDLCRMIDDWDITHNRHDMPPAIWAFIKTHRFFSFIIPKTYGGLDFSATAQAAILTKLYSRSATVATTVSVPNSLGPAELLLKYGTKAQKAYYLPRLAEGSEIPCFALTSPQAGSDAAAIPDHGIVCRAEYEGKMTLGINLTWDKRYITLAPVATLLGLAFRLFDPEGLLGQEEDVGISCALIPTTTPGVKIGRRHFPLNSAFLNGPTQGKNVFIPIDWLIGGADMAGQGWRMLMECLSAGRAISLPSGALGTAKVMAYSSGAYARIRTQFNRPIAQFEGIEEPLARIAAKTYMIESAIQLTSSAIDHGAEPAVASAIVKYHTTELSRSIINDAMDIQGGKAICLGPRNYIGRAYQQTPIGITVEGANILTRSLIIFGQGAIRCHPYVLTELKAAAENNVDVFDEALFTHLRHISQNKTRAFLQALSGAYGVSAPQSRVKRYYQLVTRYSAALAYVAEVAMLLLGSRLKRKETLSARLGDVLSLLYLTSAVLKRYDHDGEPLEDLPVVQWACDSLLYNLEQALNGLLQNFPYRWLAIGVRMVIFPWGLTRKAPTDHLGHQVAQMLTTPNATRDRVTRGIDRQDSGLNPLAVLEDALVKVIAAYPLEKRLHEAEKAKLIASLLLSEQIEEALQTQLITKKEADILRQADEARQAVIRVDDFDTL